jgi:DNA-binding FrmR family transcriptional regulator
MTTHASHPDIIKRLKRAEGHLKGIIKMMEEGRGCLDIAQQLQAVESADVGISLRVVAQWLALAAKGVSFISQIGLYTRRCRNDRKLVSVSLRWVYSWCAQGVTQWLLRK